MSADAKPTQKLPVVGPESIMSAKAHGSTAAPVQKDLRWSCDNKKADEICSKNRHYAEHSGYFKKTKFMQAVKDRKDDAPWKFYDSVSGEHLYTAPIGRSWAQFIDER
jgi:hypothetical protein